MELTAYIRLVRRWLWLIVLMAVVAGSISFVVTRTQPTQYQASTTVQVGAYLNLANPSSGMFQTAEQLAETYAALMKTYSVLNAVITKLQLPFSTGGLASLFQTQLIPGTSLMTITVTYTDPVVASDIANELATQLIANSPTNLTQGQQDQLNILQTEIDQAEIELQNARSELKTVEGALNGQNTQEQAILTARKTELINQIDTTQNSLSQMTATAASLQQQGNINSLRVVEPSRIPQSPVGSPILTRTLLAALTGSLLAIGVALVIEYFNDTLRSPSEVMPLMNVPLLGTVAPFGRKNTYKNKLITWTQPRSAIAEAYRALRVNILYRETQDDSGPVCRLYAVTSGGPAEGKSVTTANLAVTFAIIGMRVLVVDADLRRPAQHYLFNLPNTTGLSNLWSNQTNGVASPVRRSAQTVYLSSNGKRVEDDVSALLEQLVQKTEVPGLDVITGGPTVANPAELLDTPEIRGLIEGIVSSQRYDAIFFDTPPTLVVSDTNIIANVVKPKMIIVIEAGRTRRASAARAVQQLAALSIPVLGVVMNRLNPRDLDAGYGQYYYSYTRYNDPNAKVPASVESNQPVE
ncbi:MAG: Wzz/FepE/Etk N-terminal domain-containing protein [Aggregatilineales bacterium]